MTNKLINVIRKTLFWLYIGCIVMPFFVIYNTILSLIIVIGDLCYGAADEILDDIRGLMRYEWACLAPQLAKLDEKYRSM